MCGPKQEQATACRTIDDIDHPQFYPKGSPTGWVKNCLDCGVEFVAKTPRAKFCSGVCKNRALRKADPEKFREQARARYAADPEKFQEQARVRRYSGGFSTAMMHISNAMKKLKEEEFYEAINRTAN
jgi:hypothetical protein